MNNSTGTLCNRYLSAWQKKDADAIMACVHPDVRFISPNATTTGRDNYRAAAMRFFSLFDRLDVLATFTNADGAMFSLDFHCIPPIGSCPTAERVALKDGLIWEDQLFFDARPFEALMRARALSAQVK